MNKKTLFLNNVALIQALQRFCWLFIIGVGASELCQNHVALKLNPGGPNYVTSVGDWQHQQHLLEGSWQSGWTRALTNDHCFKCIFHLTNLDHFIHYLKNKL